jgi:hypothetical protein
LNLNLTAYTVAPCWDETLPYYGLFVERGDLTGADTSIQLIRLLDRQLALINIEYASKRESQRLGPLRLLVIPTGAWQQWDRQRLARTGGTLDQYKHPCLIPDPQFREGITVEEIV